MGQSKLTPLQLEGSQPKPGAEPKPSVQLGKVGQAALLPAWSFVGEAAAAGSTLGGPWLGARHPRNPSPALVPITLQPAGGEKQTDQKTLQQVQKALQRRQAAVQEAEKKLAEEQAALAAARAEHRQSPSRRSSSFQGAGARAGGRGRGGCCRACMMPWREQLEGRAGCLACLLHPGPAHALVLTPDPCPLIAVPAAALARFEVSEGEREYRGDADDRKAMLEHRQWLQAKVKQLEKEKQAFLKRERERHEAALADDLSKVRVSGRG